jgi:hypothetical protein
MPADIHYAMIEPMGYFMMSKAFTSLWKIFSVADLAYIGLTLLLLLASWGLIAVCDRLMKDRK